jgi:tetratricopeptide (TPR) repeat protein
LGQILWKRGLLKAATLVLTRGLVGDSEDAFFHLHLGHCYRQANQLVSSRLHYERALCLSPDLAPAHQGLAYVFDELGDGPLAEIHRDRGFQEGIQTLSFHGSDSGIPLLLLASARGGNVVTAPWLDPRRFRLTVAFPEYAKSAPTLESYRLIVNAIGDADRDALALKVARAWLESSPQPVINPPAQVEATRRLDVSRRLATVDGVRTPRMMVVPPSVFQQNDGGTQFLRDHGWTFPFLLRRPGYHGGRYLYRLNDACDLADVVSQWDGQVWLAIEYRDTRGSDQIFRKYRMMIIDGALYPMHLALSGHWKVHYGSRQGVSDVMQRLEESRYLQFPEQVLGEARMRSLLKIADTLALDYAGIDFAIDQEGQLLVFEANATMTIASLGNAGAVDENRSSQPAIAQALTAMLERWITLPRPKPTGGWP